MANQHNFEVHRSRYIKIIHHKEIWLIMKIALINFGYNKKTGIEILADNMMRQIDKIDKENEYILIVNEFAQGFYKSTPRISKKVVKKMVFVKVTSTLGLTNHKSVLV